MPIHTSTTPELYMFVFVWIRMLIINLHDRMTLPKLHYKVSELKWDLNFTINRFI